MLLALLPVAAATDLVLVREGTELRRTIDDDVPRPLRRTVTARVLERRGDLLRVGVPEGPTCAPALEEPAGYDLGWWVRDEDVATALIADLRRTWPDGTSLTVLAGTPAEVDHGMVALGVPGVRLRQPLAGLRVGATFAPPTGEGLGPPTAWPPSWTRLRLGDGSVADTGATGVPAAEPATETYRTPCAEITGRAVDVRRDAPEPPGVRGGVAGGVLGGRPYPPPTQAPARPPPLDVPAGLDLHGPDGAPAGRTTAPVRWTDWTARGDEVCTTLAMPDVVGGGPEIVCARRAELPPSP